jgi:CubicO group peptidase (beta-lactamase class C family)
MQKSLLVIFMAGCLKCFGQTGNDSPSQQIDSIFKKYINTSGPGCAVAVIKDGKPIFTKTYGFANLNYVKPITGSSVFDMASVTKQFTGFAISTLIQEGKIDANDDIRKYLPQVPNFGKVITINNLIHHTSGLRDYPEALMMAGWRYNELCTMNDVMNFIMHEKELDFEPGSQYAYSNTGYVLLAKVVEKITGETLPAWLKERVFKPLGMDASFILENSRMIIPNLATSYTASNGNYITCADILSSYGSSCMYSSVDDITKWVIYFQQRLALKDPVFMRMLEGITLNNGAKVTYGFGLNLDEYHGLTCYWHSGAWAGYRTILIHYPGQHLAIVILCNADDNDISGPDVNQVADIFLKNDFRQPNQEEIDRLKALPIVNLSNTILQKYTGSFTPDGQDSHITFTIENGQLAGHNGPNNFTMVAKNDSCFFLSQDNAAITFVTNGGKTANGFFFKNPAITRHSTRSIIATEKKEVFMPSAKQLTTYTGSYFSDELQTFYTVDMVGEKLIIHHYRRGDFELHPKQNKQNTFTCDIGTLNFYTNKNYVAGFTLTGDRVINMRFEKK